MTDKYFKTNEQMPIVCCAGSRAYLVDGIEWTNFMPSAHDLLSDLASHDVDILAIKWVRMIDTNGVIKDVTDDLIDAWLDNNPVVDDSGEETYCPEFIPLRVWTDLVEEAREDLADRAAERADPMGYHFGRNWHGVKTGGGY